MFNILSNFKDFNVPKISSTHEDTISFEVITKHLSTVRLSISNRFFKNHFLQTIVNQGIINLNVLKSIEICSSQLILALMGFLLMILAELTFF